MTRSPNGASPAIQSDRVREEPKIPMTPTTLLSPFPAYLTDQDMKDDIASRDLAHTSAAKLETHTTDLPALYVLRVMGEEKAARQLGEAGITSWAPTFKKLRLAVGRQPARLIDRPLIPGYVFARLGEDDFAAALATERVHGVISSCGAPKSFPEAEFTKVLMMAISGRFDERLPATKAKPRGARRKGLAGLHAWFEAVEASQLQSAPKSGNHRVGGEPVSEGIASSRRSTRAGRKANRPRIRKVRSVA